ncbi:hypothetical protein NDU88_000838 [Pleurodeles waltl]|uniref:Uncharacterized protein n=1 Tax=Pleurodeles waltl TaxID=8319 RepID=A0AAV7N9A1_PLEWA|nr:hypothetical protein NDU88_000838 [Pleurodeles waltl]
MDLARYYSGYHPRLGTTRLNAEGGQWRDPRLPGTASEALQRKGSQVSLRPPGFNVATGLPAIHHAVADDTYGSGQPPPSPLSELLSSLHGWRQVPASVRCDQSCWCAAPLQLPDVTK